MTLTLQIATQDFQMTPCFKMMHHCNKFGYTRVSSSEDVFSGQSLVTRKHRQDRHVNPVYPPTSLQERYGGTIKDHSTALSFSLSHTHTHTHFRGCRNKRILGSQHFMSAQKENSVTDVLPKPAAT